MKPTLACLSLILAMWLATPVSAQALRDPTQPPGVASGGTATPARTNPTGGWSVIVVDGRRHVAVGTRLYAEGQTLGRARVERITETEVWLREDRALRKVPLYPAVQRRNVPAAQP